MRSGDGADRARGPRSGSSGEQEDVRQTIERAAIEKTDFAHDYRVLAPDGSVKHVRVLARRTTAEGTDNVLFVGAVTDITDRKRAEEEHERLRQLEADLARVNRISMMGEFAASLAHEIKQPITGAAINVSVLQRWLQNEPPRIEDARRKVSDLAASLKRATDIVDRNHSLYRQGTSQREPIDLNDIVQHMVALPARYPPTAIPFRSAPNSTRGLRRQPPTVFSCSRFS